MGHIINCERIDKMKNIEKHMTEEQKQKCNNRLNKVIGQTKGIQKMIDEDRDCSDVLIQISAINSAIKSLGQEVLLNHMKNCMIDDIKNDHYDSIDEFMELCKKFM